MRPHELIRGAVQGPAELLPISSSAHSRLLGAADRADEVAVHAGTAVALAATRPRVRPWFAVATVAPPAIAVLLGERLVRDRAGSLPAMAGGLVAGSAALWVADGRRGTRTAEQAALADALWLGVAQACALWPGVSRSAATLAVARARGFSAESAGELSREALLPVLAAATVKVAPRLRRRHAAPAAIAALSTAVALRLMGPARRLRAFAAYRVAVAVGIVWQDRAR